jgi:hypothetical protein
VLVRNAVGHQYCCEKEKRGTNRKRTGVPTTVLSTVRKRVIVFAAMQIPSFFSRRKHHEKPQALQDVSLVPLSVAVSIVKGSPDCVAAFVSLGSSRKNVILSLAGVRDMFAVGEDRSDETQVPRYWRGTGCRCLFACN